nr:hypothetical protein [Tanacetum cinerariifolium]
MAEIQDLQYEVVKKIETCWVKIVINPLNLSTISFGVDAAKEFEKKNTKCVNSAGEELSAVKHKLMLLDTAAERS